jgi:hypothetical protein
MKEPLQTIYVKLVGEGVEVWRPVKAEHLRDDVYLIVDQPYDRDSETWQFGPGSSVVCEPVESADGPIPGAIQLRSD